MKFAFPDGCLLDPLALCVTQSSWYLKLCQVVRSTHTLRRIGLHTRSLLVMNKPADPHTDRLYFVYTGEEEAKTGQE